MNSAARVTKCGAPRGSSSIPVFITRAGRASRRSPISPATPRCREHEVETEIDRYISWPGQALSYKLGELKILDLRKFAENELGADFDIKKFHDAILETGSVPLPVLDAHIRDVVAAAKRTKS